MPEHDSLHVGDRSLTLLSVLIVTLFAAAVLVLGGALLPGTSVGLVLVGLALVLAAVIGLLCLRALRSNLHDSRAWTEVALVRSMLHEREALWSATPAPLAAWDRAGQLLMKSAEWQRLGLPVDARPSGPEVSIGDPPRVFVVERTDHASGVSLVLLREVTRERQALEAKDELLAIVGHELRTPLSSIKGYGQLMARQLATVQEQVQRLDELIGDVLDTARAGAGRLNLRHDPVSVTDLVESACDRFGAAQPDRLLDRRLDEDAIIEGDAARLSQVLDNLLSNAAKYSQPETPITVQCGVDDGRIRIAVRDRGVGIAAEHLPRLFDRFYRVPIGDATAPSGFGLGLSIVRDLVEAHGGQVEVASDGPGTGSTFTVVLPIRLSLEPKQHHVEALASG